MVTTDGSRSRCGWCIYQYHSCTNKQPIYWSRHSRSLSKYEGDSQEERHSKSRDVKSTEDTQMISPRPVDDDRMRTQTEILASRYVVGTKFGDAAGLKLTYY